MNKNRVRILILGAIVLSAAVFSFAAGDGGLNCYTVLVGKNASADGAVMIAHNEDDRGDIVVNLRRIQARTGAGPRKVDLGRGAVYETDGRTNAFLWIEATTQEFADSFINEYGVVVTSDSCGSRETKGELTDGGIGYMLRRLLAERAKSAREAVLLAGELIEKFGYRASGRTYSIADKNEAWMLAAVQGRHWAAQRVPDDEIAIIPNYYTIRRMNLDDPTHFLGSKDLVEYAKANGWYDEAKDGPFDFYKAYGRQSNRDLVSDGNTLRKWRGLNILGDRKWDVSSDFPFSTKPGKKVTASMLMALMRDHYEGTEYDATDGYKNGTPNRTKFRTICTASTINTFVISLNAARVEPLSVSIWLALGKPDTTVFLPLYGGVRDLPATAGIGTTVPDDAVFYKRHFEDVEVKAGRDALLNTWVLALEKAAEADYGPMLEKLRPGLFPAEKAFIDGRAKFEAEFAALYARDKDAALKKLDDYVAAAFDEVMRRTKALLGK
jgi:dipeptidase